MLSATQRLRRRPEFTAAVRTGRKAARGGLVLHVTRAEDEPGVRVGFVVGRTVGTAVRRNLVRRRLRHLARQRVDQLPVGTHLVVRALPAAAARTYAQLGRDLDQALAATGAAAGRLVG
jgi:ribonuclease P protein component